MATFTHMAFVFQLVFLLGNVARASVIRPIVPFGAASLRRDERRSFALGVDNTFAARGSAFALPTEWSIASPCQILDGASTLTVTWKWAQNTPSGCAQLCQSQGYIYAGVANGQDCHCGASYNPALATPATPTECNVPCAGDPSQICGSNNRIQIYTRSPPAVPFLPPGWSLADPTNPCAVDSNARALADPVVTTLNNNTAAVCASYCRARGYNFAGVEYGAECWCGTGFVNNVPPGEGESWECDMVCPGDDTLLCGGSWRIQVYSFNPASATSTSSTTRATETGPGATPVPITSAPTLSSTVPVGTITATVTSSAAPHSTALPDKWYIVSPCMLLGEHSVLDTVWQWSQNTPSGCADYCQSISPAYTYAGVSADSFTSGLECHCGTSYNPAFASPAVISECDVPCAGDRTQSCGGYQRIQIYTKSPPLDPKLPKDWSVVSECAVDTTTRVLANSIVSVFNTSNTPAFCAAHCEANGYNYAGVEFADECICGTGFTDGAVPPGSATWDPWECNMPCTGDSSTLCGGIWRVQIFAKDMV